MSEQGADAFWGVLLKVLGDPVRRLDFAEHRRACAERWQVKISGQWLDTAC